VALFHENGMYNSNVDGEYSMLSLRACVVGYDDNKNNDHTLYLEIQPLSDNYVKEALEIARLSLQELKVKGMGPKEAMDGSPIAFDWCFVNYYFIKFLGYNDLN
jgi:ribonuclease T